MKVFVDNKPSEPKECLFSVEVTSKDETQNQYLKKYYCGMNNKLCDFEKGHRCNKLRCIF